MAKLEAMTGKYMGKSYPIGNEKVAIGSGQYAHIQLQEAGISPTHVLVYQGADGRYWAEDTGGSFGTLLNGKDIAKAQLFEGDVLTLGRVKMLFTMADNPFAQPLRPDALRPHPTMRLNAEDILDGEELLVVQVARDEEEYDDEDSPFARPDEVAKKTEVMSIPPEELQKLKRRGRSRGRRTNRPQPRPSTDTPATPFDPPKPENPFAKQAPVVKQAPNPVANPFEKVKPSSTPPGPARHRSTPTPAPMHSPPPPSRPSVHKKRTLVEEVQHIRTILQDRGPQVRELENRLKTIFRAGPQRSWLESTLKLYEEDSQYLFAQITQLENFARDHEQLTSEIEELKQKLKSKEEENRTLSQKVFRYRVMLSKHGLLSE